MAALEDYAAKTIGFEAAKQLGIFARLYSRYNGAFYHLDIANQLTITSTKNARLIRPGSVDLCSDFYRTGGGEHPEQRRISLVLRASASSLRSFARLRSFSISRSRHALQAVSSAKKTMSAPITRPSFAAVMASVSLPLE
jgi:hypothetical protein